MVMTPKEGLFGSYIVLSLLTGSLSMGVTKEVHSAVLAEFDGFNLIMSLKVLGVRISTCDFWGTQFSA